MCHREAHGIMPLPVTHLDNKRDSFHFECETSIKPFVLYLNPLGMKKSEVITNLEYKLLLPLFNDGVSGAKADQTTQRHENNK